MADTKIPAGIYPDSNKFSNSLIRKPTNEPENIFHKKPESTSNRIKNYTLQNNDKDIKSAKQHDQDRLKLEGIINSLQK